MNVVYNLYVAPTYPHLTHPRRSIPLTTTAPQANASMEALASSIIRWPWTAPLVGRCSSCSCHSSLML